MSTKNLEKKLLLLEPEMKYYKIYILEVVHMLFD